MTSLDERQLVELITREVIKQLKAAGSEFSSSPTTALPLILLDGKNTDLTELITLLDAELRSGQEFRLFLGDQFSREELPSELQRRVLEGVTEAELEAILDRSTILCLPWISLAGLSRLVHLQPEAPISLLVTQALFRGVPVRMRKILAQPQVNLYQSFEPTPMLRRVQGLVQEGKLMGIEWTDQAELTDLLADLPTPKKIAAHGVLSAKEVKKLRGQSVIRVPKGTVVTALAQDELKKYDIQLQID